MDECTAALQQVLGNHEHAARTSASCRLHAPRAFAAAILLLFIWNGEQQTAARSFLSALRPPLVGPERTYFYQSWSFTCARSVTRGADSANVCENKAPGGDCIRAGANLGVVLSDWGWGVGGIYVVTTSWGVRVCMWIAGACYDRWKDGPVHEGVVGHIEGTCHQSPFLPPAC